MSKRAKSNQLLIVLGGIWTALSIVGIPIAGLYFKDDLVDKGIPWMLGLVVAVAVGLGCILWGFVQDNKSLRAQVDDDNKPIHDNIAGLRGIEVEVDKFFEGRKYESQRQLEGCAEVLLFHMQDAVKMFGLYNRPECSSERVALAIEDDPISLFTKVYSMMRRKRGAIPSHSWAASVDGFQKFLLEDIRETIEFYEKQLQD